MQKSNSLVVLLSFLILLVAVVLLESSSLVDARFLSNADNHRPADYDNGVGEIPNEVFSRIQRRRQSMVGGKPDVAPSFSRPVPVPSSPLRIPNQPANVSVVNVYDYGAVGDGSTDDTQAFNTALSDVGTAGGGTVIAPRGYFFFKGTINIPAGVTLQGTYTTVPSHPMAGQDTLPLISGTLLMATAGRNNENGFPFITLHRDSVIRGLVIYYPEQTPRAAPVPYPWTIDLTSDNAAVLDIEALNPWNLIRANGSARHYISRVQGQPINVGVYIDQTYDIGRVENVHFNPWYSFDKTFLNWQLRNGRAFVIARSDWEYFFNTFAFGYSVGYHFIESPSGSCNGNFLGIGADMAVKASVLVDSSDVFGVLISNGEFTAFVDQSLGNFSDIISTQVVVSDTNRGSVRFVNTAFWGPSYHIARINGRGTVGFGDCTFCQWDVKNEGRYAISVNGTGNVLVRGSEFQQIGNQVQLGPNVKKAVITGNIIQGPLQIADGGGKAVVGLNAHD